MFETLSRRSRSLVDQQLSLIDRLERNEEDPERLESLFRLDHLAARMRRNGANLLVLAGAKVPREQAEPVPVAALINAAASEVEDYTRVVTATVPDSEIPGRSRATWCICWPNCSTTRCATRRRSRRCGCRPCTQETAGWSSRSATSASA